MRAHQNQTSSKDAGYAAVDAMVAAAILATTVSLSLVAGRLAVRMAGAAADTRAAEGALTYLLATTPRIPGVQSGRQTDFDWQLVTRAIGQSEGTPVRVCERTAMLRSVSTGRVYRASTDEACPP